MSNLDNLISKIIKGGNEKCDAIIAQAEQKAAELLKESETGADAEKQKILEAAKLEAKRQGEQIIAGKKLEIRNEQLSAKRQVIDKVLQMALDKLNSMPKDEYLKFLASNLAQEKLDGEEIILPSKYGIDIDEVNALIEKSGSVKKHEGARDISGGFILVKDGIEKNNTFEALIDYYRDALEGDIIAELY